MGKHWIKAQRITPHHDNAETIDDIEDRTEMARTEAMANLVSESRPDRAEFVMIYDSRLVW